MRIALILLSEETPNPEQKAKLMVRFDSGHFRLPVLFGSSLYVFRFGLVLCLISV